MTPQPQNPVIIETVTDKNIKGKKWEQEKIPSAKTQQNSLFIMQGEFSTDHIGSEMTVVQYIPLPIQQKMVTTDYSEVMQNLRTPIFMGIFILVLGMQIYFKQKRDNQEVQNELGRMGPLERSLMGRTPDGKTMSEK